MAAFMQELWDSGLRFSHSVHTVAECCQMNEHNAEFTISLLDRRFLAGDAAVHARTGERVAAVSSASTDGRWRGSSRGLARSGGRSFRTRFIIWSRT